MKEFIKTIQSNEDDKITFVFVGTGREHYHRSEKANAERADALLQKNF